MRCPVSAIGVEQASRPLPNRHAAVMRRFIDDVVNKGDYSALKDLVHPDYVYRTPGQVLRGSKAIQSLFEAYRDAFPDLHIGIDELVAAGDRVALAFTLTGTQNGALMGIDATGKRVEVNGTVFSRFEGGQIVEEWEVIDQLSLFEQLGVVSLPD
jgi:steroid delta-isomerase-like uncharacterized protein